MDEVIRTVGRILNDTYDTAGPAEQDALQSITTTFTMLPGLSGEMARFERRYTSVNNLRAYGQIFLDAREQCGDDRVNEELKERHEEYGDRLNFQSPTTIFIGDESTSAFSIDGYSKTAMRRIFQSFPKEMQKPEELRDAAIVKLRRDIENAPNGVRIRLQQWSRPVIDYIGDAYWSQECSTERYEFALRGQVERDIEDMLVPHNLYSKGDGNVIISDELTTYGKTLYRMFIAKFGDEADWQALAGFVRAARQAVIDSDDKMQNLSDKPRTITPQLPSDMATPQIPGDYSLEEHTKFDDTLDPDKPDPDKGIRRSGGSSPQRSNRHKEIEFYSFIENCLYDDVATFDDTKTKAIDEFEKMKEQMLEVLFPDEQT